METYNVAVLCGDLSKPLTRTLITSKEELLDFLEKYNKNQECSVITYNNEQNKVFFGTIKNFIETNQKNYEILRNKQ